MDENSRRKSARGSRELPHKPAVRLLPKNVLNAVDCDERRRSDRRCDDLERKSSKKSFMEQQPDSMNEGTRSSASRKRKNLDIEQRDSDSRTEDLDERLIHEPVLIREDRANRTLSYIRDKHLTSNTIRYRLKRHTRRSRPITTAPSPPMRNEYLACVTRVKDKYNNLLNVSGIIR